MKLYSYVHFIQYCSCHFHGINIWITCCTHCLRVSVSFSDYSLSRNWMWQECLRRLCGFLCYLILFFYLLYNTRLWHTMLCFMLLPDEQHEHGLLTTHFQDDIDWCVVSVITVQCTLCLSLPIKINIYACTLRPAHFKMVSDSRLAMAICLNQDQTLIEVDQLT